MPEGINVQLSRYNDMKTLYDSKNLPSYLKFRLLFRTQCDMPEILGGISAMRVHFFSRLTQKRRGFTFSVWKEVSVGL